MKPIAFSEHALDQMRFRGTTEQEVVKAICECEWTDVELGRQESRLTLQYRAVWNKKHYLRKQVRPIFVDEPDSIVVVTVYTYYFNG